MTESKSYLTAVALAYREGQIAPKVVAKGRGLIAEEIIKRAKESGIYVHESSELVALLMQVNLDDRIPPQLYVAVAELLAWLYRLEQGKTNPLITNNLDTKTIQKIPE
ncbi:MAG: EscU/YscU/HrcU family type III secretion system export apparatus switch protein [Nitrosomonas sp.]|jgi:flagellar biosynthesis protein|uniref:EscU/YscU/HrcU family type III secretion system export apparatus switch protein n=1 Tax=Nitrosomonas sp. TaxID=42353 RepID=UPI0025E0F54E|nr:EscU/YscU/HrcU family type III secretion system export apparatus switch protein [Nitrosomonas sp.]MBY0483153.1 EscU/YscU/HrcU family type III secretion system export apparatus switch protein [Nitrosomonas sp.]MDO8894256.1 EscU/YscU/HrcU family type III secretion system export apparatus switch protein [Nitrosomonas sp.]MDO9469111.1 EscU/YscU/HrcU family type III secretion system export apparatus switch protein [Nitrosomonas sp.]MDP1548597.1 EscU/YscU/HrcU family type III secretion system expo